MNAGCSSLLVPERTPIISSNAAPWCAVLVRPRWEKAAAEALAAWNYEAFLPLYRKRSRWSDRVKEVELPLFGGYLFCRDTFEKDDFAEEFRGRPRLLEAPGVTGILQFGGSIARITNEEIENLQKVARVGAPALPWPYLSAGKRVRIAEGSMRDVEGILIEVKGSYRVVLSVEALGRAVAVEVERSAIVPVADRRTPAAVN